MMNLERWRQIDALLLAALEREPGERLAFLEEACSGDESLKAGVQSLLFSGEQALNLIDTPAFESAAALLSEHIPELVEGQLVGHYKILAFIGAGGMGEVYSAKDEKLNRKIALKLLPDDYSRNQYRLHRFEQEAQTASGLNHPNILTIHEIGQFEDRQFIATEFVEGMTLRERLKSGRVMLTEALDIAIQISSALSAAHTAGIVHRDIKPENIMLRPDGYVKVVDFGLAKLSDQPDQTLVAPSENISLSSGLLMGTVKYMSPEQARGVPVDARSDIFSLGVVLYEMLAECTPFDVRDARDLVQLATTAEPPPLKNILPDLPERFVLIVNKALSKDRDERYANAADLLVDLRILREELGIEAGPQRATNIRSSQIGASHTDEPVISRDTDTLTGRWRPKSFINIRQFKSTSTLILIAMAIVIAGLLYSPFTWLRNRPTPFESMTMTQIAGTQASGYGVISPNGEYIAYVKQERGESGLWMRRLRSNDEYQIVPDAQVVYVGLTFTPDNSRVFYVSGQRELATSLHEVPTAGGEFKKVLDGVAGSITFSPDGKQFGFVRLVEEDGRSTALIVANSDGSGEREIARRSYPDFFNHAAPSWSADGRVIACTAGSRAGETYMNVVVVPVEGGPEKPISTHKWASVEQIAWLADSSGLMIIAAAKVNQNQLWRLPYPEGEPRKITNDLNSYARLTMTADSKTMVTVRVQMRTSIWQLSGSDAAEAKQITDESDITIRDICWLSDGRIVFISSVSGSREIWIINADGTDRKQLTTDGQVKAAPSVSRDGRYIVFSSRGPDGQHIWRMNTDGSNLKQLTFGQGENYPDCAPDGSVIYMSGRPSEARLWKVAIEGGEPVEMTKKSAATPKVSLDGKLIACWYKHEPSGNWKIAIIPFDGDLPVRTFDIPVTTSMRWARDGNSLNYIVTRNGVSNLWSQPIDGGPPRQLTNFNSLEMYSFDWTREGMLISSRGFGVRDLVLITDAG